MSSAQSLFEAFFLMIITFIISAVLIIGILMPYDNIHNGFVDAGVYDVSATWNSQGDSELLMDIIYGITYGLPLIGLINFLATAVRREEEDIIGYGEY